VPLLLYSSSPTTIRKPLPPSFPLFPSAQGRDNRELISAVAVHQQMDAKGVLGGEKDGDGSPQSRNVMKMGSSREKPATGPSYNSQGISSNNALLTKHGSVGLPRLGH